ncbi:GNAT family N-acetyltransferase [Actinomadura sp. HBU206391]|uniref:bifunctional acetate--CoA ligase family protein/GNAT family N-acetyltransferase n=1 Tax=Actinomadura sp. HBU206391 TaxID=2731692 RepID=UPI0016505A06|nr:GNAT family N-acetyltransferase [Actinomadura sp. HBU206391]MBC6459055.1 GNAT family N-acetyltransferase [Actinomadura sp. HBU206391]
MKYPDHWEADVVLADGGTAHLRPIRSDDAESLRSFYARLSSETIYYRFFGPRPQLSEREITHFTTLDHDQRAALIATVGDSMLAVVRYDKLREEPGVAEVAFLVEDAHQGRGIGSVLLEHIAAAARERRLRRFVAHVLPDNRRMAKIFRDAGYRAEQRFEDGVIRLTLDLEPTETSIEVMTAREHRAESRSIQRLLFPRSVAVVGASREAHSVGQTVLRNLLTGDFSGPVYPVHPTATAVAGVRAHPTVLDIADDVDLVVVAVPAGAVHEVVEQSAGKGVHGLVVVSAGFGETGPAGRARQEELVRLARAHGMRVVGPNCLGIANTDPGVRLNATLAPTMPGRGPIGFFSQSGALGIAILQRTAERGIGLSTFVSAGNRADVSGNDLMQYWEEDPATTAVLLYLESIGNPRKFTRLARRLSRKKPIVAVKSGRTTQGVPLGHAARALTLPDHAVSALFAQAGVIRVEGLSELFDVAQLLAYQPLPAGDRVAIIDNSDSLGLLAQDAAATLGLDPIAPVNLGPRAGAGEYESALAEALADDSVDAVVTVFTPPVMGRINEAADAAVAAGAAGSADGGNAGTKTVAQAVAGLSAGSPKPIVATYLGLAGMPAELRICGPDAVAGPGSVPSYATPEDAMRALAYVMRYAAWRRRPKGRLPERDVAGRDRARALVGRLLAADGPKIADDRDSADGPDGAGVPKSAGDPDDAAPSSGPEGRTEDGQVVVAPADVAALLASYGVTVAAPGGATDPSGPSGPSGHSGIAVRIVTREDPSFGAVVSFGLSGATAALLDDRAYRLAPLTDVEAAELVRAVRSAPLLFGHRGADPVDVNGLEDLLLRVSQLADDLPEVARLELDPVVVSPSGVTVAGATLGLARPVGPRPELGPRRLRGPGL